MESTIYKSSIYIGYELGQVQTDTENELLLCFIISMKTYVFEYNLSVCFLLLSYTVFPKENIPTLLSFHGNVMSKSGEDSSMSWAYKY